VRIGQLSPVSAETDARNPVERPTTLELVINLKAAKALGLTIPPSVMGRAEHLVE
jgi:putative ABC transport system substrate-binding protein